MKQNYISHLFTSVVLLVSVASAVFATLVPDWLQQFGSYTYAPTTVSASDGTHTDKVAVTWNDIWGATGYVVLRCSDDTDANCVNIGSPVDPYFDDTGATPDVLYYYRVQGTPSFDYGELSDPGSGYRSIDLATLEPQNVQASNGEFRDKVTISWDALPGAASYKIFKSETAEIKEAVELVTVDSTTMTYDDLAVEPKTAYYYWLKAFNPASESNFSSAAEGSLYSCSWFTTKTPSGAVSFCL